MVKEKKCFRKKCQMYNWLSKSGDGRNGAWFECDCRAVPCIQVVDTLQGWKGAAGRYPVRHQLHPPVQTRLHHECR